MLKLIAKVTDLTKVELEQAGEEAEGMAESTSRLREQVMALTNVTGDGGVDILNGTADEYRSMYDIFADIAKVWKDMNDMDQAALLELLAGKVRANTVAAMLNNWSQAEASLEAATTSAGSALQENERYLQSIQGHLDRLTTSWQEMWNNAIDNDILKFIINVANRLVQIADKLGPIEVLFASIAGIMANRIAKFALDGGGIFGKLALQISDVKREIEAFNASLTSTTQMVNASAFGASGRGLGFKVDKTIAENNTKGLTALQNVINNSGKGLSAASAEQLMAIGNISNELRGPLISALKAAKTDTEKLAIVQKLLAAQMDVTAASAALTTVKMAGIQLAITAVTYAITYAIGKWKEHQEAIKRSNEEQRKATIELADNSYNIRKAAQEYEEAKAAYQSDPAKEHEYRDAVEKVVASLGDKAEALENLNKESERYIDLLEQMTANELAYAKINAQRAVQAAENDMREALDGTFRDQGEFVLNNFFNDFSKGLREKFKALSSDTLRFMEDSVTGEIKVDIAYDPKDAQSVIDAFSTIDQMLRLVEEDAERTGRNVFKDYGDSYSQIVTAYDEMKAAVTSYLNQRIKLEDITYTEANGIPKTVAEYKKYRETIAENLHITEEQRDIYEELVGRLYPDLDEELRLQQNLHQQLSNVIVGENKKIVDAYNDRKKAAEELSVTETNGTFGNVGLAGYGSGFSQSVLLAEKDLDRYKQIISEWELTQAELERFQNSSIVLLERNGVQYAVTPVMVDPLTGERKVLDKKSVLSYLDKLARAAEMEGIDPASIDLIDFAGTHEIEVYGEKVIGLIADVGDTAEQTANKMDAFASMERSFYALEVAARDAGVSAAEFLKDYTDNIKLTEAELAELDEKLDSHQVAVAIKMLKDHDWMLQQNIESIQDMVKAIESYESETKKAEIATADFVGKIDSLKDEIDNAQAAVSSMGSVIEKAFSGSLDASEFLDTIQELAVQIASLGDQGDATRNMLSQMLEGVQYGDLRALGKIAEQVADQQLNKLWKSLKEDYGIEFDNNLKSAIKSMTILEMKTKGASTGLSNLASAYQTAMSAIDQYNEDGIMTINTITSLLSLEPQYLQMLSFEHGQLVLNEQKLEELAKARIADAKAAVYANAEHQIATILAQDQTNKLNDLKNAQDNVANGANDLQGAMYGAASGTVAASAEYQRYAAILRNADRKTANGTLSRSAQKEINEIRENANAQIKIYDQMQTAIVRGSKDARNKVMGYTNDASKNAEDKAKEAADTIKSEIDGIISKWKRALDAGGMSWSQYLRNIDTLSKKYRSQLSEEDYQEYQLQVLEGRKEMYEKAAAAVQNYLSRQKDGLQDQISALDEQTKQIEKQISTIEEKYDDLIKPLEKRSKELEKQKKVLEDEIEAIEDGYAETLKPLQKQLQALQDQADAIQAIIDSINAYYDTLVTPLNRRLEELEHTKANLEDALSDINAKYDELVKPYNKQIDNKNTQISALQRIIKERQREIDKIKERYEVEIEANEKIIKSYQKIQKGIQARIKEYEREIKILEERLVPYEKEQEYWEERQHELNDDVRRNNAEIRKLEAIKEGYEDIAAPLEKELELLKKANDERNKELELMKAQMALAKAESQRTKLVNIYARGCSNVA